MVLLLNESMMKGTVICIYFALFSGERSLTTFPDSHFPSWCVTFESPCGECGVEIKSEGTEERTGSCHGRILHRGMLIYAPAFHYTAVHCGPSAIGSPHLTYRNELIANSHTHVTAFRIICTQLRRHWEARPELMHIWSVRLWIWRLLFATVAVKPTSVQLHVLIYSCFVSQT